MQTTYSVPGTHKSAWIYGFLGMCIFSGSLPATKAAVLFFEPVFLTAARASIAGLLALAVIFLVKGKIPSRRQILPLFIVAFGVVLGFPLFTAIALQQISSAHSIVFLALLPLSTAIFAVWRGNERPKPAFWLFSILGSLLVMGFAFSQGIAANLTGDLLMLLSVVVCGFGYAEGAVLAKQLGGLRVICWALVLSLPIMLVLGLIEMPAQFSDISTSGWVGLAYVSVFSMFIGFIFWYRGLAQGGTAAVGQLQLLQPFFGLILSAWLLHESISLLMVLITIGVIFCVIASKRFAR